MKLPEHMRGVLIPIHPQGWPFIGAALVASALLGLVSSFLFWMGIVLVAWMTFFFRDPKRVTPEGPDLVVSPADGTIQAIARRIPPPEVELGAKPLICISVFLNVFDVHVNRTPVPGRVAKMAYRAGTFVNAALDKASEDNERQCFKIETAAGDEIGLVQIAGLVARRIVTFVKEQDHLHAGERVGLIRFGSRCDVYLPDGLTPLVAVGQRAVAGETVFADGRRNRVPAGWRRS